MARAGTHATVAAAIVALTAASCASAPRRPLSLRIPGLAAKPVVRLAWIDTYPRAISTVAFMLEREFRVPRVKAALYFYESRSSMSTALMTSGIDPVSARELASNMGAIASEGQIFLNEELLTRRPWSQRISVLAHELMHSVQYQLADGHRGASDQWIREGFSEWAAVRVLERLDVTTLSRVRSVRLRQVRAARSLPSLSALTTPDQWLVRTPLRAETVLYPYAFLAVDTLIQQHGAARVIEYFRLFAFTDDREWAFTTAFGQSASEFERSFRTRVWPADRPR
jgi:hypothetical protein